LQIIFGLHAVAAELRVARHALVFFQKLRRIAALAVVLAIAVRPTAEILWSLSAPAATAATLSIIDQISFPSKSRSFPFSPQAKRRELRCSDPFVPVCA
jgi:hypothetical protein